MNFFELLSNFNYKVKSASGVKTEATFTGNRRKAIVKTKTGFHTRDYYEYEIKYDVDGKLYTGYITFYPLADPAINEIENTTIEIVYKKKKPSIFTAI